MPSLDQPAEYTVRIHGRIDGDPTDWLGPMQVAGAVGDGDVTTLGGIVTDQAGIVGLVRRLHSLGIVLLSVERLAPGPGETTGEMARKDEGK